MEEKGRTMRFAEQERLALGCTGVKRTTGQHPGGIVVIPNYMDVLDFTPFQYPADDVNSKWFTTHFDYHPMELDLLKLDILGHDDPTVLRMLQDLSGIDILTIPLDDKDVLSIFSSPDILGVTKDQIMSEVGTYGIPEFGTKFVIDMLVETRPKTFAELVKISGLSHGTDVWRGNAQDLIKNKICEFSEVIGCRDDIMVYLSYHGLEPKDAFKIMEFVRKGKASKEKEAWETQWIPKMKEKNITDWYIDSCTKIKYMFPKAHAVAYVMMACRVAWFKVHKPIYYYAAYLSIRCHDFDIEAMINGYETIKERIIEIQNKGFDKSNKEDAILDVLYTAMELTARGFKIGRFDLYKSDAINFVIDDDNKTLIPPFRAIDGLGDIVAKKIIEERVKGNFISIEDLAKRAKVSGTLIDKMRLMGILKDMPETNQLTLF
jgi:DNA polymerase-3 subunit alpha (Gram-positive type)